MPRSASPPGPLRGRSSILRRLVPAFAAWSLAALLIAAPPPALAKAKRKSSSSSSSSSSEPRTIDAWIASVRAGEKAYREQWSVLVKDLESGRTILSYGASDRLIPASNRKVMVFAMAMDKLGPEYRFRTELGFTKSYGRDGGTITASAVLRGTGDPTLRDRYLEGRNPADLIRDWVRKIREQGITTIRGDFVIDASSFGDEQDRHPLAWENYHRNYSYAPYPSAIALNENLLRVTATSSGVRAYPSMAGLPFDSGIRWVSGSTRGLDAKFVSGSLVVGGTLGRSVSTHETEIPLERPLQLVRGIVVEALRDSGITVSGKVRIVTDPREAAKSRIETVIASRESPPLLGLLDQMLTSSDNFLAEQIWRATAYRATGDGGVTSARRLERDWYVARKLPWIEPGWDGSGLSRMNRVSASEMVAVLEVLQRSPWRPFLAECLPRSGISGTLKGRSFGTESGRVLAKTGTLSGATSLSGVMNDRAGRPRFVFSILSNAPDTTYGRLKSRIDQIMKIMFETMDSGSLPEDRPSLLVTDGSSSGSGSASGAPMKRRAPGTKVHMEGSL